MTKIYFFTEPSVFPTTRFRAEQYIPYFHKNGYDTVLFPAFSSGYKSFSQSLISVFKFNLDRYLSNIKNIFHRWQQINQINTNDNILYIHSFLTPFIDTDYLAQVVRKKSRLMVLDMDDALFVTNKRTEIKLKKVMAMCDAVIVGNEYLADFAQKYQSNIYIIPTPIETNYYVPKKIDIETKSNTITIGWMGSWVNLKHLNLVISSLIHLQNKFPHIHLKIVTNIHELPPNLKDIAKLKQWSVEDELKDLQSFDIGLMPLEDNAFSRGKCSFKLLQYMAVGIPVIASPVGMNKQVVQDNGFLCETEEEWLESLLILCENKELRQTMGKRSREIAEKDYSTQVNFLKLHRALTGSELSAK
ncbi:glycosyltransferase family 4 protein [Anabaena sphaerica FACHB-251]|uniref:Glycosyltransferase family 4 protein n=1 Tax=Anabaena sphaerica FACHB-251 TaxID=2692883 RepID=A0A927A0J7_9NOST|nr:glycosyltransferase family 4 protein [Anabaena sphaerica]MBD2292370.1 glycosyltransferase family 4 protein [Anabaena sphaerica FACHB-251]